MADTPTDLEARIRRLEDIEAIRTLRMEYHHIINEGELHRATEIYTEDAHVVWATAGRGRGHAEIIELFKVLPAQADFVKHFVANHMVEVDGDEATGMAYVNAYYARGSESSVILAKYDERYRRTSAGWRISETLLHVYCKAAIPGGWADQVSNQGQFAAYR
jgi:ketosteroid isomerase-like protein